MTFKNRHGSLFDYGAENGGKPIKGGKEERRKKTRRKKEEEGKVVEE